MYIEMNAASIARRIKKYAWMPDSPNSTAVIVASIPRINWSGIEAPKNAMIAAPAKPADA